MMRPSLTMGVECGHRLDCGGSDSLVMEMYSLINLMLLWVLLHVMLRTEIISLQTGTKTKWKAHVPN